MACFNPNISTSFFSTGKPIVLRRQGEMDFNRVMAGGFAAT
jgi:hypothetical protein